MSEIKLLANIALLAKAREEMLDGIPHLVVPAVIIKHGVLNNIYYSPDVLSDNFQAWNGVPVPVNHPTNERGLSVTANSVESENTFNIGRLYNVSFEDDSLKAELWINIEKAERLGFSYVTDRLKGGELMEVSTGLFGNLIESNGIFNSKTYNHVISNIKPDHLALLPGEKGACSVEDGCGAMRTNEKKPCCDDCGDKERVSFWNKLKEFFIGNEQSHDEVRASINAALVTEYDGQNPYILEVVSNSFVYEVDRKLYKRSYTLNDSGNAILVGENSEVKMETSYVPVSAKLTANMKEQKRNALVDALALAFVANADQATDEVKTKFGELPDAVLENMAKDKGIVLDDEGKPVTTNEETPTPTPAPQAQPVETPLENSERETLARLVANENKRLDAKREKLLEANTNLTKELVANMDEATMDALLPKVDETVDYGISPVATNSNKRAERPSILLRKD